MTFAEGGKIIAGAPLNGISVIEELNKDFYGCELLAIITPRTIRGINLVSDEYFEIQHGVHVQLDPLKRYPRSSPFAVESHVALDALNPISPTSVSAMFTSSAPSLYPTPGPPNVFQPVRGPKKQVKTHCDRLLVLHTQEKLKKFTRSLLSFTSVDYMAHVSNSAVTKQGGDQSAVLPSPRSPRKSKRLNPAYEAPEEPPANKKSKISEQ